MGEMVQAMEKNEEVADVIDGLHLPDHLNLHDLFLIIDDDCGGTLTANEFQKTMESIIYSNDFQRSLEHSLAISKARHDLHKIKKDMQDMWTDLASRIDKLMTTDLKHAAPVAGNLDTAQLGDQQNEQKNAQHSSQAPTGAGAFSRAEDVWRAAAEAERRLMFVVDDVARHSQGDVATSLLEGCFDEFKQKVTAEVMPVLWSSSFEELKQRITTEVMPVLWHVIEGSKNRSSAGKGENVEVMTQSSWSERPAIISNINGQQLHDVQSVTIRSTGTTRSSGLCCTAPDRAVLIPPVHQRRQ